MMDAPAAARRKCGTGETREAIERIGDAAVRRIFHRDDTELRLTALDFFEHGRDRARRAPAPPTDRIFGIAAKWLNVNSGPR